MQQGLVRDMQRLVKRLQFIWINAALAAFDFCQSTAGQIAACKLWFCRKLFLRQTLCKPRGPDCRTNDFTIF